jgi:hypothetical protein
MDSTSDWLIPDPELGLGGNEKGLQKEKGPAFGRAFIKLKL